MRSQAARLRLVKTSRIHPNAKLPFPQSTLRSPYSTSSSSQHSDATKSDRDNYVESPAPVTRNLSEIVASKAHRMLDASKHAPSDIVGETEGSPPPDAEPDTEAATLKRPRVRRTKLSASEKEKPHDVLPPRPSFDPKLVEKSVWQHRVGASGSPVPPKDPKENIVSVIPDDSGSSSSSMVSVIADPQLPPAGMLDDMVSKLLVALHPHAQNSSIGLDGSKPGNSIEPTFGLYCPIEGANDVVDKTVRELATRVGADVIVLDAAQLAAGESGIYGEAASAFNFSPNPLHVARGPPESSQPPSTADEENTAYQIMSAPSMVIPIPTITIGGPGSPIRPLRTTFGPARRSEDLKMRFFFDSLVHMPFPPPNEDENRTYLRPRLIYVRDFDYLAPHASVWYPHLLAAVRELRQGGASGSKVANSIVVVFGVSAELDTYSEPSATSESGKNTPGSPTVKKVSLEQEAPNELFLDLSLNDEEFGDRIREKRLQSWLRHWEAHGDDAIRDALPWFSVSEASELRGRVARVTSVPGEGMKVISGDAMDLPEPVARFLRMVKRASEGQDQDQEKSPYFNVATAIPAVRNPEAEGAARLLRREELNWLAFRMALKRLGGSVSPGALSQYPHYGHRVPDATEETTKWKDRCKDVMDVEWERSLVDFDRLQEVAKRAMGLVMVEKGSQENGSILESQDQHTKMSWHDVSFAWHAIKEIEYERKAWVSSQRQHMGDRRSAFTSQEALPETDEVVERVKADPNLDPHEKRLLGCIVDPTSMPTTFASVHLPEKTIDAIRTMISLPLLYPKAFEQGVLKNHSMNGALLLGPPGVGKTLLARAVARESGARMLMVKPSDVMDMYVGEGEKLVRSVFSLARRLSPCVVFLDEVDALFASRVSSRDSGGAIAHRSVITEFMQEMDGLKTNKSQGSVIVVGATNRPFDLDDAVLRRLPRRLLIDLPGEKDRLEILKIHLRGEVISPLLDLKALAKRTEMYSGSDLKNLVVAAALDAVKERVDLPWSTEHKHTFKASATSPISQIDEPREPQSSLADFRILEPQHFDKAMEEITPSSSEHLGTLHELRKWNEEFGEGRAKNGGRKTRWGEKFGFGGKDGDHLDGRVMKESPQPPP